MGKIGSTRNRRSRYGLALPNDVERTIGDLATCGHCLKVKVIGRSHVNVTGKDTLHRTSVASGEGDLTEVLFGSFPGFFHHANCGHKPTGGGIGSNKCEARAFGISERLDWRVFLDNQNAVIKRIAGSGELFHHWLGSGDASRFDITLGPEVGKLDLLVSHRGDDTDVFIGRPENDFLTECLG